MKKDFLLTSAKACELYEGFAAKLPIIDYHNHLSVQQIKENKRFDNIYDVWVGIDPYKHRAMRMCGVEEKYITGDAEKSEKFRMWCSCVPRLIGNPLYHWTVMELAQVFDIHELPNAENWDRIYEEGNRYLALHNVTVESFFEKFNVEFICPCVSILDSPDDFENNEKAVPSLRGDDITSPNGEFISKPSTLTGIEIDSLEKFESAVQLRLNEFKDSGCVFSDHALDDGFTYFEDDGKNGERFEKLLNESCLAETDAKRLFSYILTFLCGKYAELGMVVQLHIGAQRYTSSRLRTLAGAAGGFAAIGNSVDSASLTKMLDEIEKTEFGLPKTVLFTLNPEANAIVAILAGSYSKDGVPGLITQGPAWWWCDQKKSIVDMLENTMVFGLLDNFIGMTTDSRSFLSLVRHDYFRRILCSWIAEKIDSGDFPDDEKIISQLICDMCYKNAKAAIENSRGEER